VSSVAPPDALEQLLTVAQALMSSTGTADLLATVAESALGFFDAEACSVSLYDDRTRELEFFVSEGRARVPSFRMPVDRGIAGHVFRTGLLFRSNDVASEPLFFSAVDARSGHRTRSMICAPVAFQGERIGTVQVLNTSLASGFTAAHEKVLSVLSGMIGAALARARSEQLVRATNRVLREEADTRHSLVTGKRGLMEKQLATLRRAARSRSTVLLLGESGVGKEVAARALHGWSDRSERPFVAVNCAALSAALLESELFGHERGAFTGAVSRKRGKFELAEGGTIFLDEVGELAPELQAKLLRVVQDGELSRVGGSETLRPDVRIVAATNRDLKRAVDEARFRLDLYYRLNVISVTLPPLRDRPEDIPDLAAHFLRRSCIEQGRPVLSMSPAALERLRAYAWPGNVRELANVIERAVVLCSDEQIDEVDLPDEFLAPLARALPVPVSLPELAFGVGALPVVVAAFKRQVIESALTRFEGNQAHAAKYLGIHPSNLSRQLKQLGMR
jgi:transcriptional regulator with GAF, ATPase, and Fis domain